MGEPRNVILDGTTILYYDYPAMNVKFQDDKVVVIEHKRSSSVRSLFESDKELAQTAPNKSQGRNFLVSIFKGCFAGVLGSIIFGAIGSLVYWLLTKHAYQPQYDDISLATLVLADAFFLAAPIGFGIGLITGVYSEISRYFSSNRLMWIILSSLSGITGFYLSGIHPNNFYASLLEISILNIGTSWVVSIFTIRENTGERNLSVQLLTILGCLIGSVFIFIVVYNYFKLVLYAGNIPS